MKIVYTILMSKDIYTIAYELKELLANDERIIHLNQAEEKMNNNDKVISLAYQKDMACVSYSDALNHFSENDQASKDAQKELHQKKLNLDNHPVVREYLDAYKEVRDLYFALNDILFSGLNLKLKEHR